MRFLQSTMVWMACGAALAAQGGKGKKETGAKLTPVFDASALDPTADPCVDFYQYACGTWLAKNPIPPDRPEWARFDELEERNLTILREILEKASVNGPRRSAVEQKIGDYYAACMDEAAIEKKGIEPIKPELDRIAALAGKDALAGQIARLHRGGTNVFFSFTSQQDFKNANAMIASPTRAVWGCRSATITSRTIRSQSRRGGNIWSTSPKHSSCWATRRSGQRRRRKQL